MELNSESVFRRPRTTDTTNDDDGDDVDVMIVVTGGSEITAYSADQDDDTTPDFDESSPSIGIFADAVVMQMVVL